MSETVGAAAADDHLLAAVVGDMANQPVAIGSSSPGRMGRNHLVLEPIAFLYRLVGITVLVKVANALQVRLDELLAAPSPPSRHIVVSELPSASAARSP